MSAADESLAAAIRWVAVYGAEYVLYLHTPAESQNVDGQVVVVERLPAEAVQHAKGVADAEEVAWAKAHKDEVSE